MEVPWTVSTFAEAPNPSVPVLSKVTLSFTL